MLSRSSASERMRPTRLKRIQISFVCFRRAAQCRFTSARTYVPFLSGRCLGKNGEIVDAGHHFFGDISKGLASIVERAADQWGRPNGYILGEEAGGAFIGGLRFGDGTLYTKDAGDLRVFWQGPTIGVDVGGDGARTMMLVYNLPRTDAIYEQFNGIAGAAYFIAGLGMTALRSSDEKLVVVPIRSGLGLRLGYNVGYLKFTTAPTWNPF